MQAGIVDGTRQVSQLLGLLTMANRIFVSSVVVLWLCSMGWLVTDRILPSFYEGQPPIVEVFESGKAVSWTVEWSGQTVGRASSLRLPGVSGTTELHNRVMLENMPVLDLAPAWMRTALGDIGNMTFDAATRIELDSLGNFSAFESRIVLNDMPSVLRMSGRVKDSYLRLTVNSGQLPYTTSVYLPNCKSLNESLFPGAKLPHMYVGRRWQDEIYSPFRTPGDPIELVQAEVVSHESLEYMGAHVRVMRVEYSGIMGSGVTDKARLQAVSWVDSEGDVLQRDVYIGNSKLRFIRLDDDLARENGKEMFADILLANNLDLDSICEEDGVEESVGLLDFMVPEL
jgi:hypothetical protein